MKSFLGGGRESLFPSVGKSWKILSYSKPKSTKSYTNRYLVFKGLCLYKGEVPPRVSSDVGIARRVWKNAHQVLGLENWSPSVIQWFKKGRTWGYSHSQLFVPPGVIPSSWVPLTLAWPSSAWGTHVCWWKLIFDSLKTNLSLTSPTSWRSCRPSVQVRGWDSCDGIHRASAQQPRGLGSSPGAVWPWES